MIKRVTYGALIAMIALLCSFSIEAAEKTAANNEAVVTAVEGSARVFTKGTASGRSLRKGDRLKRDNEVSVGEKSRIEIRFPDGTIMRLSEKSQLAMNDVQYNNKTENKNVKVNLSLGKLWAKVKRLTTPDSSVEVKTVNAVAGVRGTVYRVNVEEDKSALIKVYDGSVYVASPPKNTSNADQSIAPHEVAGPHPVPPSYHEVSMEEWTAIVKAMQQISISPQGVPSKPEDFDPKADSDDWVKWNQARDKLVNF